MIAAAYLENLPASTKLVLLAVADSCDEQTRESAPGLPKIRAWSGLKRSQALAVVADLCRDVPGTRPAYLEHVGKGRVGRRAVYRVFPQGVPAIPKPEEVVARFERSSPPVDNSVEKGPADWTLDLEEGPISAIEGPAQTGPLHASTSVSSARRETPTPLRPVDRRPTSSAPSTGFPGARAASEEDRAIARRARGAHNVACHIAAHAAAGEIVPCGRCAHEAANSDPAKVAEAKALIRAALRGAS